MFNLGGMEILVILVVALLVLGPDKLPGVMRTVGKALGELRKTSADFQRTMGTEIAAGEKETLPLAEPPGQPAENGKKTEEAVSTPSPVLASLAGRKRPSPRIARKNRAGSPAHRTDDPEEA